MEFIFQPRLIFTDPSNWEQPDNVGNTGGASPAPHGTYNLGLDENRNLSVLVKPAVSTPWDTFYFLQRLGSIGNVGAIAQRLTVLFPTADDIANCGAFEWEIQQCVGGNVWNCGWQMRLPSGQIYAFNYVAKEWIPIDGVTMVPQPGVAFDISTEHILSATSEKHCAIWLSGHRFPVNFSHPIAVNVYPGKTGMNVAFQIDSIEAAKPIHVVLMKRNGSQVDVAMSPLY